MTGVIDCYFAPFSGYAYLGHPRLMEVVAETGAELRMMPVDILKVFGASETVSPAKQSEVRRAYRQRDMARWAALRGLPLNTSPKFWPAPSPLPARLILASPDPAKAAFALLRAVWAQDLNIADAGDVRTALDGAGLDGDAHLAAANAQAERAEQITQTAIALGVFGSPTFVVGGELFWGQDRLDFVADAVRAA